MTKVELIIVSAIIGPLFFILISPAFVTVRDGPRPKVARAKSEINGICAAINQYETAYGHFPVPDQLRSQTSNKTPDLTFGTKNHGLIDVGGISDEPLADISCSSVEYNADNRDVMAILMALPLYPDGSPTCNSNNALNPQKTPFLNAKMTGNTNSPGIGNDYVFRDPWGNPYIISLNLNGNEKPAMRSTRELPFPNFNQVIQKDLAD